MPLDRIGRWDPLVPGVSIGVAGGSPGTLGTLGMFVCHPKGGLCILTADHVIAPKGNESGLPVYQPRPLNHPNQHDQIGYSYKRLKPNGVALVRCVTERKIDRVPLGAEARLFGTRLPRCGDILKKSGRTTGITCAKVIHVGAYPDCTPGFKLEQLDHSTNKISMGGDSGSIWYDPKTYEAIGVHCGGDKYGRKAWAASLYYLAPCLGLTLFGAKQAC